MDAHQTIESFHLALLTALADRASARSFVLKGGANLRFFYTSVRYFEDIDLDVPSMQPWKYTQLLERAISSDLLGRLVQLLGTTIEERYRRDHTDTDERWLFSLSRPELADPIRTSLEVSYQDYPYALGSWAMEQPPATVTAAYGPALRPPLINHYLTAAAISQKIRALAGRAETQPRDVFDLDHLFRGWQERPTDLDPTEIQQALARIWEISYEQYSSKVLTFIEPVLAETYGDRHAWEEMQLHVAEELGRLA